MTYLSEHLSAGFMQPGPGSNFPETKIGFLRHNHLSYKYQRRVLCPVLSVNTIRKSHNHSLPWHWKHYPQPRIIFSRSTQAKYHQITRKNSALPGQSSTAILLSGLLVLTARTLFPRPTLSHPRKASKLILFPQYFPCGSLHLKI